MINFNVNGNRMAMSSRHKIVRCINRPKRLAPYLHRMYPSATDACAIQKKIRIHTDRGDNQEWEIVDFIYLSVIDVNPIGSFFNKKIYNFDSCWSFNNY